MARAINYRTTCPDDVYVAQGSSLDEDCEIFIVRELGPLGFVLQETIDGQPKHFNVSLGSEHSCTCPAFRKKRDLCKHICWLLLKRYRLDRNNPLCWQKGLVDREINELLYASRRRGQQQQQQVQRAQANNAVLNSTNGEQPQRPIDPEDICPVCQETFASKLLPVTYCRFGCGNNVHTRCMKIWADHQHKQNSQNTFASDRDRAAQGEAEMVRCPMCRGNFSTFVRLKLEYANTAMDSSSAVAGRRAAAIAAAEGAAAGGAQVMPTSHMHPTLRQLLERQRDNRFTGSLVVQQLHQSPPSIPIPTSSTVQLQPPSADQSTSSTSSALPVPLTKRVLTKLLGTLPLAKLVSERSKLLAPGQQCLLCFHAYALGELVYRLPRCRHQFHRVCLERRVLESRNSSNKAPKSLGDGDERNDEEDAADGGQADADPRVPLCPIDRSPIFEFASSSAAATSSSSTHPVSPTHHSRPLGTLSFQNGIANVNFAVGLTISGIKCAPTSASASSTSSAAPAVLQHQTLSRGAQASRAVQLHRGRPPLPGRPVPPPSTPPRGSHGAALVVDGGGLSGVAASLTGTSHVSGNSNNLLRQQQELSSEVAAAGFATSDPPNPVSLAARAGHALSAAASAGAVRATATRSAARETATVARRGSVIAANTDSARGRRVGSSRSSSATRNRSLAASGAAVRVREASGGSGTGEAGATPQRVFSGRISQPTTGAGEHRVASASQDRSAIVMGPRAENTTASVSGTHSEVEVPLVTSSNAHS